MFREACAKAAKFTFPVVVCQRTVAGKCSASIGAFVVLNDEGWIATCFHLADLINKSLQSEANIKTIEAERAAVSADASLGGAQKKKKLAAFHGPRRSRKVIRSRT
jgi:hypothetical protein